jgi:CheY-like chemotaxis protein
MAKTLGPDLLLMDCRMPGMDGLEATRIIKRDRPQTVVVALSMYPELESDARAAGADAFLMKGCPGEEVVREIRKMDERVPRTTIV